MSKKREQGGDDRHYGDDAYEMSVPDKKKVKWRKASGDDDEKESTPGSVISNSTHQQQQREEEEVVVTSLVLPPSIDDNAAVMAARGEGEGNLLVDGQRQAATSMPSEVFPLVWSFLLEPKRKYNAATDRKGCLDFKSIASFMLVSRGTKQAFDTCNGWSQCLLAVKQEIQAKEELVDNYNNQMDQLRKTNGLVADEDIPQCTSLLEKAPLVRDVVAARLLRVMNGILPLASHLAGTHCGEDVPSPAEFEALRVINQRSYDHLRLSFTMLADSQQRYEYRQEIVQETTMLEMFEFMERWHE